MSLVIYIYFVSVVTYVYFWGLLLAQRVSDPVNRALRLFVLTAFCWAFVELLLFFPFTFGNELLFKRITSVFWAPLTFVFLRFLYVLLDRTRDWMYYILATGVGLAAILGLATDFAYSSCIRNEWGVVPIEGPYHAYLALFPGIAGVVATGMGITASKKASTDEIRRSLRLMAIGVAVSLLLAWIADWVMPEIFASTEIPRLGFASTIFLLLFIQRAVVRHKFLAVDVEKVAEEIFESLPDGVVLVDRTNRVRRMNQAARELFGVGRQMIGDLKITDILVGFNPTEHVSEKEFSIHQNDDTHYVTVSSSLNLRSGVVVGQLIILRDITPQKKADELLEFRKHRLEEEVERQSNEMVQARTAERVGLAAGVIAHDFNNILVGIIAYSSLAKEELPLGSPLVADFEEILKAGRKARDIVSHILTFSRRGEEKWEQLEISRELLDTVELLDSSLPANIELVLDVERDVGHVFAAPSRLRQIVMNISTNGYQAMKKNGGRLTIALKKRILSQAFLLAHRLSQKGPYAEITFTDTGEGLFKDQIDLIFEPFFTTKEEAEGSGLGLSTALRVATEIGGIITCESEVGEGSTFRVYLPLWDNPENAMKIGSKPCTVLVVDDDESIGLLCKRLLEPLGYTVETQTSPQLALAAFEENTTAFDVVITDQQMPQMMGTDLLMRLWDIRPELPGILISTNAPAAFRTTAEEMGVEVFLQKPLDQDKLKAAIDQVRKL